MLEALPRYQEAPRAFLEADQDRDRAAIAATRMAGGIRDDASGLKLSAAGHAAAEQAREVPYGPPSGSGISTRRHDRSSTACGSAFPLLSLPEVAAQVGDPAAAHCGKLLDGPEASIAPRPLHRESASQNGTGEYSFQRPATTTRTRAWSPRSGRSPRRSWCCSRDTHHSGRRAIPLRTWQRDGQHRHGFRSGSPWTGGFRRAFGAVQGLIAKYYSLDYRLLSELIVLAERIETAIGLELLADPPEIPST